jgi:hypothetical protein
MAANLKLIEKQVKQNSGRNESNPIAAAFVHKLAEFVRANNNNLSAGHKNESSSRKNSSSRILKKEDSDDKHEGEEAKV